MINANELRIGNAVMYECTTHFVTGIKNNVIWSRWHKQAEDEDDCFDDVDNYSPIPLTPERLEKCGFENDDSDYLINIDDRTCIHINLRLPRYLLESYDGMIKIKPVRYLHQLQNLYFALTGEELIYKP